MNIEFKDPADQLARYRSPYYIKKFDKITRCIIARPEYLSEVLTFLESWRIKNLDVTELILKDLRKRTGSSADYHDRLLCDTLFEFQTMTAVPTSFRKDIIAAFIEYMVLKKMESNYLEDSDHRVKGYDLHVYIDNDLVGNKRIDIGVILCCHETEVYQAFECKSFPQDILESNMLAKIQFLQKVKTKADDQDIAGEIYVLTLHNPSAMAQFGITQGFYPGVIILDRKGIVNKILKRKPLCDCKASSSFGI